MSDAKSDGLRKSKNAVIMVRLPRELHAKLVAIAHDARRSLNKECIEALTNHVTRVGTPET